MKLFIFIAFCFRAAFSGLCHVDDKTLQSWSQER